MERKCPRKLNFNAPLLSTRRPSGYLEEQAACSGSHQDRVPFCWEQAPGKPKNLGTSFEEADEAFTPRPKLPPGRWRPPTNDDGSEADSGKDVLSLTEAIDIVEKEDQVEESQESHSPSSNLDRLTLRSVGELNEDIPSPNFMMERFLPDAAALATATSALNLSRNLNKNLCQYPETRSSTKACGLEMVLPWRMRQRLAGVKSLVQQAKRNTKQKKRFPSLHITSADWSCK